MLSSLPRVSSRHMLLPSALLSLDPGKLAARAVFELGDHVGGLALGQVGRGEGPALAPELVDEVKLALSWGQFAPGLVAVDKSMWESVGGVAVGAVDSVAEGGGGENLAGCGVRGASGAGG